MAGGRIVVVPPAAARFQPEDNVIVGNVCLYGATGGELFACGVAGERFAVRNSGARAVVEGVGDHGCEYMTGGAVVVLGPVGRNFGAGMTGGDAFVLDEARALPARANLESVALDALDDDDARLVRDLIEAHVRLTGSPRGARVLASWDHARAQLVRVVPRDGVRARLRRAAGAG
jgi:glutamate synthase domain-containing protein 3